MSNDNYIAIAPESHDEAKRLFRKLSKDGKIEMPLKDMFWGDYFGSFKGRFGVC